MTRFLEVLKDGGTFAYVNPDLVERVEPATALTSDHKQIEGAALYFKRDRVVICEAPEYFARRASGQESPSDG